MKIKKTHGPGRKVWPKLPKSWADSENSATKEAYRNILGGKKK